MYRTGDFPICTICIASLKEIDSSGRENLVVSLENCGHTFHESCVNAWFTHGRLACPVCKRRAFPALNRRLILAPTPSVIERVKVNLIASLSPMLKQQQEALSKACLKLEDDINRYELIVQMNTALSTITALENDPQGSPMLNYLSKAFKEKFQSLYEKKVGITFDYIHNLCQATGLGEAGDTIYGLNEWSLYDILSWKEVTSEENGRDATQQHARLVSDNNNEEDQTGFTDKMKLLEELKKVKSLSDEMTERIKSIMWDRGLTDGKDNINGNNSLATGGGSVSGNTGARMKLLVEAKKEENSDDIIWLTADTDLDNSKENRNRNNNGPMCDFPKDIAGMLKTMDIQLSEMRESSSKYGEPYYK